MKEHDNSSETRTNRNTLGNEDAALHPAWRAFIHYCQQMGHGEIELLKIQDGVPVLVEVARQKIKFS